jgi:hypothetical protein
MKALPLNLALALVAIVLSGCGPSAAESRSASYASDQKRTLREMRAQLVLPVCKGDTEGYKACGLITHEYAEGARVRAFVDARCHGTLDDDCIEQVRLSLLEAWAERYNHAVPQEIESRCAAEQNCEPWAQRELRWLESHNDHVMARAKRAMGDRREQDDRDVAAIEAHREQMRAIGEGFRAAGQGMQQAGSGHGCVNDLGCNYGSVCLIPQGATHGQCFRRP